MLVKKKRCAVVLFDAALLALLYVSACVGQTPAARAELGSRTARAGFRNETEIAAKFNNWKTDPDARSWLTVLGHRPDDVISVAARKPHGEKADVEVVVKSTRGEAHAGISIKLVSSPQGFNQIDKRWVAQYARMWKMPPDVATALKYFVGETPPHKPGRTTNRMYLNELDKDMQRSVVDFFTANKAVIVADLFAGDGAHSAGWMMVALRNGESTRWTLRRIDDVIRFFSAGSVSITRNGNLKIGRITMQRKGGDAGRETATMLQFKINPVELFDAK